MTQRTLLHAAVRLGAMASWLALGACASVVERVSEIGQAPPMAAIQNPLEQPTYRPVTTPLPALETAPRLANSLWRPGSKAFFRDQRAARVGDILTVNVKIDDKAAVSNATNRSRDGTDTGGITGLFGLEGQLTKVLPDAIDPTALLDVTGKTTTAGTGAVTRSEAINLTVAALVTQILPNGNLVIQGRQQVVVNFELRELTVSGIVRPEDISATNTINHSQIAEARISYGGKGQIMDMQQPRYGQQLLDIIAPF